VGAAVVVGVPMQEWTLAYLGGWEGSCTPFLLLLLLLLLLLQCGRGGGSGGDASAEVGTCVPWRLRGELQLHSLLLLLLLR
jgi:hypothetical protein